MSDLQPSLTLLIGFIGLPLFMLGGLTYLTKSWKLFILIIVWVGLTATLSLLGITADFSTLPPPALLLLATAFTLAALLAFSSLGTALTQLSTTFLIGFLSFRIIVELLMHQAVTEGVAPVQMSWNGSNYDMLAGVSALIIAPFADKIHKNILMGWNTIALGLVLWTVSVGVRSLPIPIQQFELGLWVTQFPFIWLPTVLAPIAFLGHLLLYRKLLNTK